MLEGESMLKLGGFLYTVPSIPNGIFQLGINGPTLGNVTTVIHILCCYCLFLFCEWGSLSWLRNIIFTDTCESIFLFLSNHRCPASLPNSSLGQHRRLLRYSRVVLIILLPLSCQSTPLQTTGCFCLHSALGRDDFRIGLEGRTRHCRYEHYNGAIKIGR